MHCRQCHERVGEDWIEWRQRHTVRFSEYPAQAEIVTVEQVVLCALPRICAEEYAQDATVTASVINAREAGDEPF